MNIQCLKSERNLRLHCINRSTISFRLIYYNFNEKFNVFLYDRFWSKEFKYIIYKHIKYSLKKANILKIK